LLLLTRHGKAAKWLSGMRKNTTSDGLTAVIDSSDGLTAVIDSSASQHQPVQTSQAVAEHWYTDSLVGSNSVQDGIVKHKNGTTRQIAGMC